MTAKYVKYEANGFNGYVHSGMLKSAEKFAKGPVRDAVIQALKKNPTYSLVLCGHSLGGGVAALLTLLWSREITREDGTSVYVTNVDEGLPLTTIRCFVYVFLFFPKEMLKNGYQRHYVPGLTLLTVVRPFNLFFFFLNFYREYFQEYVGIRLNNILRIKLDLLIVY